MYCWFADCYLFVYPTCTLKGGEAGTKFLVCTDILVQINMILITAKKNNESIHDNRSGNDYNNQRLSPPQKPAKKRKGKERKGKLVTVPT